MAIHNQISEAAERIEQDARDRLVEIAEMFDEPMIPEIALREARLARYFALATLAATLAIFALTVVLVLR